MAGDLDLAAANVIRMSSGALLFALGVFCLLVRPRTARARWLGLFLVAYGPYIITTNLPAGALGGLAFPLQDYLFEPFAFVMLVLIAWTYTRRVLEALLPIVFAAATIAVLFAVGFNGAGAGFYGAIGAASGVAVALARQAVREPAERMRLATLAGGLAAYAGMEMTWGPWAGMDSSRLIIPFHGAIFALVVASWAWAANADGPGQAAARNVALFLASCALAGLAVPFTSDPFGAEGVVRFVAVGILAYGIFRHDLLRVHMRPHTVEAGTLATVFLVTLLILAQILENALSAAWGLVVGGAAAGIMVFAVRPLERFAERWAAGGGRDRARARETYRRALRLALHDGAMTSEEEDQLAQLAEHLGLGPRDVLALRRDAERTTPKSARA